MVLIRLPPLVREHSHAALVFVGLAGASILAAFYGSIRLLLPHASDPTRIQSAATLVVAGMCAALAIAVSRRRITSSRALELTVCVALAGLYGITRVEIATEPALFGSATARCCLIVVIAGIVVHSRTVLIALTAAAIASWLVVVSVAAIPFAESIRWWPTWVITAAVALAAHAMTSAERRVEAGVRRDAEAESWTDALTGLANRRGFREQAAPVVALAHRSDQPLWCAFIDLDHFKQVNDAVGHEAGDQVLVALADSLRSSARASDVLARWGGDEFVLLGVGPQPSEGEIERRIATVAPSPAAADHQRLDPRGHRGRRVGAHRPSTPSTGLNETLTDLLAAADRRMYRRRRIARRPAA